MVEIVREQIFSRQSALFVEVLIILQKNISKGSERKRQNIVRLVIRTTDVRNVHLGNILDVNLKITLLQNFRSHRKKIRNKKSNYFLMKRLIVHAPTEKITVTKVYMHLWHVCLVVTNFLVEILVTVSN